jgi:oligopeptide transport system ATP-binding protein
MSNATKQPVLSIQDLTIRFKTPDGWVKAVNGVSLDLNHSEILGIVGESGSGKSQSFMAPMGLLADNAEVSGRALFEGQDLLSLDSQALNKVRGTKISMVFQDPMTCLNPYLSIATQMMEGLRFHNPGISKQVAKRRCIDMLDQVAIPDAARRFNQYPHELSGGMRQRLMIAMALLNDPKVLIADEPTTALDVTIQAQILDILRNLQAERHMSIVLITHDLGVVAETCDRVAVMYGGRLQEVANAQELFEAPQHPYTIALMQATPRVEADDQTQRLAAIPGQPPNMRVPPPGCAFFPRCAIGEASVCSERPPELVERQPGHSCACFRADEAVKLRETEHV